MNRYPVANKDINYVSVVLNEDSIVEFPILNYEDVELYVICGLQIYYKYSVVAQKYYTVPINHLKYIRNLRRLLTALNITQTNAFCFPFSWVTFTTTF